MMRALDPAVYAPAFEVVKSLLPPPPEHPLGCHRRRVPDELCFQGLLLRLVTGASWETVEMALNYRVSDTTLRARRDEWVAAGIFEQLVALALHSYHSTIGLDLNDVALDASNQPAPWGREGVGPNYKDQGKRGWKWCLAVDATGIPIAWTVDAANRNDYKLMFPVIEQLADRNLTRLVDRLHADRGFNYRSTPQRLADYGITNFVAPSRNKPGQGTRPLVGLRRCWIVEATHAWLRNYGQLRRNTDRTTEHRHAALCLAIALLIIGRITNPRLCPIR